LWKEERAGSYAFQAMKRPPVLLLVLPLAAGCLSFNKFEGPPEGGDTSSSWTSSSYGLDQMFGGWSSAPNDVWIAGATAALLHTPDFGQTISVVNVPASDFDLHAVWGAGPTTLFVVGAGGTLLHTEDLQSWTHGTVALDPPPQGSLNGVWGSGPTDVYAVGDGGLVLHTSDGNNWSKLDAGGTRDLFAVCGAGAGGVIAHRH
jgi:photosystem II stability/assembly factor-like uncharacterized protein